MELKNNPLYKSILEKIGASSDDFSDLINIKEAWSAQMYMKTLLILLGVTVYRGKCLL